MLSTRTLSAQPLLDPALAWASLPPDTQSRLGMAAIAHVCGALGDRDGTPADRAHEAAAAEAFAVMEAIVSAFLLGLRQAAPLPDLNALGVRMCRACGGTTLHAGNARRGWSGPTLCTACAPPGADGA